MKSGIPVAIALSFFSVYGLCEQHEEISDPSVKNISRSNPPSRPNEAMRQLSSQAQQLKTSMQKATWHEPDALIEGVAKGDENTVASHVMALMEILDHPGSNPTELMLAARFLGHLGHKASIATRILAKRLDDTRKDKTGSLETVRDSAAKALSKMVDERHRDLIPKLLAIVDNGVLHYEGAAIALGKIGEASIPHLIDRLGKNNFLEKFGYTLSSMKDYKNVLPPFFDALKNKDPLVRSNALDVFSALAEAKDFDPDGEYAGMRRNIVVQPIDSRKTIKSFKGAFEAHSAKIGGALRNDPDPKIRLKAASTVYYLSNHRLEIPESVVLDLVRAVRSDPDGKVKEESLSILSALAERTTTPWSWSRASSREGAISDEVIEALNSPPAGVALRDLANDSLLRILSHAESPVQGRSRETLVSLTRNQDPQISGRAEKALRVFDARNKKIDK